MMEAPSYEQKQSQSRIAGLDVLRAAAIIMVLLYHLPKPDSWIWLRALTHFGWAGVDLFFVLSGYLIASQLFSIIPATQFKLAIGSFYGRRFFRTLPSYYVVLALTLLSLLYNRQFEAGVAYWKFLVFVQNYGIPAIIPISWSLCIEEQFYLVFPLTVFSLYRCGNRKISKTILIVVIVGGMLLRAWIWSHHISRQLSNPQPWVVYLSKIYYPTYTRLDGLVFGISAAALARFRPLIWARFIRRANLVFIAGLALLAISFWMALMPFSFVACVFSFPMLAFSFTLMLVAATSEAAWLNKITISGTKFIAQLSYSMYLTHLPAFLLVTSLSSKLGLGESTRMLFFPLSTLLFAVSLHYAIEDPFLRLRDRLFAKAAQSRLFPSQSAIAYRELV